MKNKYDTQGYYEAVNRSIDNKAKLLRQDMRELAMEGLECNYF